MLAWTVITDCHTQFCLCCLLLRWLNIEKRARVIYFLFYTVQPKCYSRSAAIFVGCHSIWYDDDTLCQYSASGVRVTWSMFSRSGSRLILRQHSGPPRPDSGHTCRAFTVSYNNKSHHQYQMTWYDTNIPSPTASLLSHHVGVGSAGHTLAGVEVEEFVDLWGGQSISNLQLLDDEHLPGERLLATGSDADPGRHWPVPVLSCHCHRVGLVLEGHLKDKQEEFEDGDLLRQFEHI